MVVTFLSSLVVRTFFFYLSVEVSQFTAADTEGNGELTEENGDSFVQINGNR